MNIKITLENILKNYGVEATLEFKKIRVMITPYMKSKMADKDRFGDLSCQKFNLITTKNSVDICMGDELTIKDEIYKVKEVKPFYLNDEVIYIWALVSKVNECCKNRDL